MTADRPSDSTVIVDPSQTESVEDLREEISRLRTQLREAQKLMSVGVLTSSITHEFNNILMTIINYGRMGLRHRDDATREKAFDRILTAGQRAARITTGMLSLVRGNTTRQEPTRLVTLIDDVLILMEKDLTNHRVTIEKRCDGDPWAELNASQIQQVLLNLMINARQAMDGGGRLFLGVGTDADGEQATIEVRDTGCGIPPETLARIFEPFYTTKTADDRGQGGTGLGLSLCRDIMHAHGGGIRAESKPGEGTRFLLRLPAVPAPEGLRTTSALPE